jgi:hypothetical protein
MSTKHTATLPDGTIATRTSANRVYPFVIARGPLPVEEIRADLEAEAVHSDEFAARYAALADYLDNGGELVAREGGEFGVRYTRVFATGLPHGGAFEPFNAHRGIATIGSAEFDSVDAVRTRVSERMRKYAADAVKRSADLRERKSTATPGGWAAAAWSSRSELAARTAESTRRLDPRREVRVLDTERVSA